MFRVVICAVCWLSVVTRSNLIDLQTLLDVSLGINEKLQPRKAGKCRRNVYINCVEYMRC